MCTVIKKVDYKKKVDYFDKFERPVTALKAGQWIKVN